MSNPADLEASIAHRRDHLADTVDELIARAHPKAVAERRVEDMRRAVQGATRDENGQLRRDRLAIIAAVVSVLVALLLAQGARSHRS